MVALDLHRMRWQPIYAFLEADSMLDYLPAWQREYLHWVRDEGDFTMPDGD